MIEQVREFWDRRPCNVRHSPVDIDVDPIEYSVQVTRRKYFVEPHILPFAEFPKWCGKRVIDLGCGIGTQALTFAQYGAYVIGVDFSGKSLQVANKRIAALGYNNIQLLYANIEEVELPYKFDLVWMFGVLHHTPDPDAALATARKLTGGVFKLMVYNALSYRGAQLYLQRRTHDTEAQKGCPIARMHTKWGLRKQLERHGFRVVSMKIRHIFPWSVPEYIKHEYVMASPWRYMRPGLFQWLSHRIGWHLLVEAV